MPKQAILVATENKKAIEFLTAYFADTQSTPTIIRSKQDIDVLFDLKPDFIFVQAEWIDGRLSELLRQFKTKLPKLRLFCLGRSPHEAVSNWNGVFEFPLDEKLFRKTLLAHVEFPPKIKLMVVDDEVEIGEMIQDYFGVRTDPPFEVRTAPNGLEGFKLIEQDLPHCLILDLKMPVRTGVELYQDLVKSGRKIPIVIFIDSTTADDIHEIRKWGAPVFVEKGGHYSSMPDMLALVKKLVGFS